MASKTYRQLKTEIEQKAEELDKLKRIFNNLDCQFYVTKAFEEYDNQDFFNKISFSLTLAGVIAQRDEPLTRQEIEHLFDQSGFDYSDADIEAAGPNREEEVLAWRESEYAEEYGVFC